MGSYLNKNLKPKRDETIPLKFDEDWIPLYPVHYITQKSNFDKITFVRMNIFDGTFLTGRSLTDVLDSKLQDKKKCDIAIFHFLDRPRMDVDLKFMVRKYSVTPLGKIASKQVIYKVVHENLEKIDKPRDLIELYLYANIESFVFLFDLFKLVINRKFNSCDAFDRELKKNRKIKQC